MGRATRLSKLLGLPIVFALAACPGEGESDAGDEWVLERDGGPLNVTDDAGAADGGPIDGGVVAPTDGGSEADGGAAADGGPADAGSPNDDAGTPVNDAGAPDPDLGWPFPDDVPSKCAPLDDTGGDAWTGWGNIQHPDDLTVAAGASSDAVYGQVYRSGDTEAGGQATGWDAELIVGPWGTDPTENAECYEATSATYNVDVGNNDEYEASVQKDAPGLYAYYYRYRPPGGAWLYADLDGTDNGLSVSQAGRLVVTEGNSPGPLKVVTLNLRCHADSWPARKPILVESLARIGADLMAFQEDCAPSGGVAQSEEIRVALAAYTKVGYDTYRQVTHQATVDEVSYDEGISVLSAHPIEDEGSITLPYAVFQRRAAFVDVTVRGQAVRFFTTHFDFGFENEAVRVNAAEALLAAFPMGRLNIVGGDLNTTPDRDAYPVLAAELTDLWSAANPSQAGVTFPASAPERRIDYLFVDDSDVEVLGARLLDDASGAVTLSDHLGVAAAITLP